MATDPRKTIQITAKTQTALRRISKLTGLKMWAATEQAILEKLTRVQAEQAKTAVSA